MLNILRASDSEYIQENLETIMRVYEALEDEKSRTVYVNRLLINYLRDFRAVRKLADTNNNIRKIHGYVEFYEKYRKLHDSGKLFIYYGVGTFLDNQLKIEDQYYYYQLFYSIDWKCLCDKNPAKIGTVYRGYEIISREELITRYKEAYIVIGTYEYNEEIRTELMNLGIPKEQILDFPCPKEESFEELDEETQYFESEILQPLNQECFIDCGCFLCDTITKFIEWNPNYKQIIAFEPVEKQYAECLKIVSDSKWQNVKVINGGVYSSTCKMGILEAGAGSELVENEGNVDVYALSDFNIDSKVTYIKMDIEGAELDALKGAEELIKKDRPRLAICIYHKKEDPVEIANWILELGMDYKLYMRHYSNFGMETVLYAV